MSISVEGNSDFITTLFHRNEIVSVQLPTISDGTEKLYATIKNLIVTAPYVDTDSEQDQLNKILVACKLQPQDFRIRTGNCSWATIRKFSNIQNILLFGVSEKDLGINCYIPENQIIEFDERRWVRTFAIDRFLTDATAKNTLWQQALKPLYID